MKTIIIAAMMGLTLSSCSKNNREGANRITGQWEHRKDLGGIVALIEYPAGNGNIQVFNSNKEFRVMNAGAVVYAGSYEIKETPQAGKWLLQLKYTLNGQQQTSADTVRFEGNQLIYLPFAPCCDIQTRYYEKLDQHP